MITLGDKMPKRPLKPERHRPTNQVNRKKNLTLWESWVAVMAIAQLVNLGIVLIATSLIKLSDTAGTVTVLHVTGLLTGIVLGIAQWLVLRRYIRHVGKWIAVTAIAMMIAWLIGIKVSTLIAFIVTLDVTLTAGTQMTVLLTGIFLLGAWIGTVLGLTQWLVLKHHIRLAVWWVFANALAWALGLVVAFMIASKFHFYPLTLETALAGCATGLATGAVVGAITGVALVWILKPTLSRRS